MEAKYINKQIELPIFLLKQKTSNNFPINQFCSRNNSSNKIQIFLDVFVKLEFNFVLKAKFLANGKQLKNFAREKLEFLFLNEWLIR